MDKNSRNSVIVFTFLTLILVFELSLVLPLAPAISKIYSISVADVSLLNLGYAFAGLFSPFFGYMADRHGVKKTMIFGMALFTAGCFTMSLGEQVVFYIISRAIIGLGYYSVIGIIYSYTALIVDEKYLGRISGIYKIFFGLAILGAPVLGSILISAYSIGFIYSILGVLGIISIIFLFLLKYPDKKMEKIEFSDVKILLRDKKTYLFIAMTFSLTIPAISFYNYYSIYLESLGLEQVQIGNMYVFLSVGSILAGFLILFLSDRFGKFKFIMLGCAFCVIGILPLSSKTTMILMVFSFIFGLGYDIVWGLHFTMASLVYKKATGTFLTILSLSMAFTNIFTNTVSPIIYRAGGFRLNVIVCLIALVLTALLYIKVYYFDKKLENI